jgi:protein arginine N-methyltransferase 2
MGDGEFEGEALDDHEISALTQLGLRLIDAILSRAAFEDIQTLVAEGAPVWFQDEEEGISSLHAAAYTQQHDVAKFLIDAGAPWNAGVLVTLTPSRGCDRIIDSVDNFQTTAADIALSSNDEPLYNLIRDAGIRAGLLFVYHHHLVLH